MQLHRAGEAILPLDLEHTEDIQEKVDQVIQKFGKIDVLINNGGIGQRGKAVNTKTEVDRKVMEINFFGTINLSKAVARVRFDAPILLNRLTLVAHLILTYTSTFRGFLSRWWD